MIVVSGFSEAIMPVSGVLKQFRKLYVRLQFSEYVKVCSLYGVGFYYIPGTDICMKLGGYVRFQQNFGATDVTGGPFAGVGGLNNRVASEDQSYRVRWLLQHDTRQQTAYGTLRTYMILGFSQDSGTDGTAGFGTTRIYATRAFIQLAGFTFGKATSYFDFVSSAAVAYNAGATSSPDTGDAGHVVAAYTAQLGKRHLGHDLVRTRAFSRRTLSRCPGVRRHCWGSRSSYFGLGRSEPAPGHRRQPSRRSSLGCCPDRGGCA